MAEQYSAEDFLLGGGVPSAKFPAIGVTVVGRITEKPTVSQQTDYTSGEPKVWADGSPQLQLVVTLDTALRDPEIQDDDGARRIYVKGQLKKAVADTVRRSGAKGLEVGGVLSVTYTGDGTPSNPKMSPPKMYSAAYTPAAAAELQRPEPGQAPGPQPAQPAPAQYAPPAAPAAAPAQYTQPAAAPVPGLTAEQFAAAQADPGTAALLAQLLAQQAQAAAPAAPAPTYTPQPGVDAPPF